MRRLLPLLLLLSAACPGGGGTPDAGPIDASAPECAVRADCSPGLLCQEGACVGCEYDRDCEGNELCHPLKRICEFLPCFGGDCDGHAGCSLGEFCVQGLCRQPEGATGEEECPKVTPCASDAQCPTGLLCNLSTLVCEQPVPCTSDAACPAEWYCDFATGKCEQACTPETEEALCASDFSCESGRCVECADDAGCGAGLTCDPELGRCVGSATCFTNRDCLRPLVCNRLTGKCTTEPPPCISNEDCGLGEICELRTGACISGECAPDALEPNDTQEAAAPIAPGLLSNLTLCEREDDWYQLALGSGDRVSVTVNPPPLAGSNFTVTVHDPVQALASGNLQLDWTAPAEGAYDLRIRTTDARAVYGLQYLVSRGIPCEDDGYEPNDAFTAAHPLGAGEHVNLMRCPGDADWYVVEVPRTARVRLELAHDPLAGDLDLYVWDADGVSLLGRSDGTSALEVVETPAGAAGRVLVEIRADDRTRNAYDLTVGILEGP